MLNPVTPDFVYWIHNDKERALKVEIERTRAARERWAYGSDRANGRNATWLSRASLWFKEKALHRAPEVDQKEALEQNSPAVPC